MRKTIKAVLKELTTTWFDANISKTLNRML